MPEKEITPTASRLTQLAMATGRLCHRGTPVDTKNAKEALKNFIEWLKANEGPVVLFVHNAKLFDCKCIIYSLENVILLVPFKVLW